MMVGAVQQNRLLEDTNDGRDEDPNFDKVNNVLKTQEPTVGNFDDEHLATNESEIYYDESYSYLSRKDLSHFSKGVISGFGQKANF